MLTNEQLLEKKFVIRWLLIAFGLRLGLMLLIHFTGAEKSLSLTKDSFLYDRVGLEMAEYFRTGDAAYWPTRVSGFIDFGWEYVIGCIYYLTGHQPLAIKILCVMAGTLTPLVHYRTAALVTGDQRVARLVLILSVLFPTQVYYSTLMVRDTVATLGISLIFLGIAEYIANSKSAWMIYMAIGWGVMISMRSYLAAILGVTVPLGFVVALLVGGGGEDASRGKLALIGLLMVAVMAGVVGFAPEMLAEVDTQFTDLSYINKIRRKLNKGSGAFFQSGEATQIGEDVTDTAVSFGVGIYFFFFSINPSSLDSIRQFMALPEVVLVAVGAIYSIRGARVLWNERRYAFTALMVPTLVITFGYSVATTNGGPLMRWRMQLLGVYLVLAATGLLATRLRASRSRSQPVAEFDADREAA